MTKQTPPPPTTPPPPRTLKEYFRRPGALSQRALARRLGSTQSFLSMVAGGKRACKGAIGRRLAAITEVPLEKLVTTPETRKKQRPRRR